MKLPEGFTPTSEWKDDDLLHDMSDLFRSPKFIQIFGEVSAGLREFYTSLPEKYRIEFDKGVLKEVRHYDKEINKSMKKEVPAIATLLGQAYMISAMHYSMMLQLDWWKEYVKQGVLKEMVAGVVRMATTETSEEQYEKNENRKEDIAYG